MKRRCGVQAVAGLLLPGVLAACVDGGDAVPIDDGELEVATSELTNLSVLMWPDGDVSYAFAAAISVTDRNRVKSRMQDWNAATTGIIDFVECTPGSTCPTDYLTIRYNTAAETGMACGIGRATGTAMRIGIGTTDDSTLRHELGHCIGLAHEHQRPDRDRWLTEGSYVYEQGTAAAALPILGNYDYDSIMHYASFDGGNGTSGTLRWKDALGNTFSRWVSDDISPHDVSRVLQYYARENQPDWDFFQSLATVPANADARPNPYLAAGVEAVGTPAIADVGGTSHVFARGSDDRIYWKQGLTPGGWTSLGCCFGSDPAAVRTGANQIDVVAVGGDTGKLLRSRLSGGAWSAWFYVQGGFPSGGLKATSNGHLGAAIASREDGSMDLFVVRADGRLASVSYGDGAWTDWRTHGSGYVLTGRPAAVALSSSEVRLAVTAGSSVHEPSLELDGTTVTSFVLGAATGSAASGSAPAITKRNNAGAPYRVLVRNSAGRVSHHFAGGTWRDIGGIPQPGTGLSAVATGSFSADIVMNGIDAMGCDANCLATAPDPSERVQPGGIWVRRFE